MPLRSRHSSGILALICGLALSGAGPAEAQVPPRHLERPRQPRRFSAATTSSPGASSRSTPGSGGRKSAPSCSNGWDSSVSPTTGAPSTCPSFDAEMDALKRHGIELVGFWFPAALNDDARVILDLLKRHNVRTQLWVTMQDPAPRREDQAEKVGGGRPRPPADRRRGGQDRLHGRALQPRRLVRRAGEPARHPRPARPAQRGPRLQPAPRPRPPRPVPGPARNDEAAPAGAEPQRDGQGRRQERQEDPPPRPGRPTTSCCSRTIRDSGYRGPIGIIGHTQDDAEQRLQDNLDGLDWLIPQLTGKPPGPKPRPRTSSPSENKR